MRLFATVLLMMFCSNVWAQPEAGWVPKLGSLKSLESGADGERAYLYAWGAYEAWLAVTEQVLVDRAKRNGDSIAAARQALRECTGNYDFQRIYELAVSVAAARPDEPLAPFIVRTVERECADSLALS